MKNLGLSACLLALSFAAGCSDDDDDVDATLTVVNESDFVIEEIYLTEVDNTDWGRNLLGDDPLLPDEELTLGVDCDFYDALLIDEDGVECELSSIDLCSNDATWFIYNDTCVAFEAARKAREAAATETGAAPPADTAAR
jgi:hypothetical protein